MEGSDHVPGAAVVSPPIRIWHQSITELERLPSYAEALREHAAAVCGPDVTVDVHGVAPGTYPEGVAPIRTTCYPWAHQLLCDQIVLAAIEAERAGYDAVACSCFLDPALREARSVVDIPVVSALETSLTESSVVAGPVGMLGLGGAMAADMLVLARGYGLADRIAAMVPVTPELTEHELDDPANHATVVERVRRAGRTAIAAGAELLIPGEGMLNTLLARRGVTEIDGVPVLDAFGLVVHHAEMFVRLRRATELRTSRQGRYAKPPDSLRRHLTAATARAFTAETAVETRGAQP
ncbi:aspartate/glutamate racemase family protein [Amycolatopsis sp. NPDC051903]|uniref:aspartate/glutamate racemase family protein n=1 Tax=Amycolatopsis sp. NPDC051903 TaxID=3363936 RepID=UPI0037949B76